MKKWVFIAAVNGALAVLAGAFGAHALSHQLVYASAFTTGAHYHLMHALAMGLAALAARGPARKRAEIAAMLFLVGVILFSGSLYLLAVTGVKYFGFITPVGGISLIAGWIVLALAALKLEDK
jgi:uncharacterized membrane protein YgdD (TMEM256/DUF423 family)